MSAPTPEIRTRFTLAGLRQAGEGLRAFGTRVTAATRPIVTSARRAAAAVTAVGKAAVDAGRRAASGLRAIATRLRAVSGLAGRVAAGGLLAGGGGLGLAVRATSKLVLEQERLSRAGGAATESMTGLTSAAAAFGVESDEVMGALSTLSDKIAESARGEGAREFFDQLGISATDGSGRLRDTTEVLDDLMRATRSMNRTERASIFNELLGGDAEKLAEFLDVGGAAKAREFEALARSMGAIATPQQVQATRRWRESLERGRLALRGVALEVAGRFLPVPSKLVDDVSSLISSRRGSIADWLVRGWNRAMRALRSMLGAIAALAQGVRATIAVVVVLGTDMARRLAPGYGIVGGMVALWLRFLHVVVQVYAAFTGRGSLVRSGWILSVRDGVIAVLDFLKALPARIDYAVRWTQALFNMIVAYARVVVAAVPVLLDQAKAVVVAWANSLKAAILQALDDWIIAPVRHLVTVIKEIWNVLAQGGDATVTTAFVAGIREELIAVREVAVTLVEAFKTAWGWFMAVHRAIVAVFGENVTATLMFFGLLRVTGLLGIILGGIKLVSGAFAKLWALGKAGVLTAALARISAAITGMFSAVKVGTAATLTATAGGVAGAFATAIGAIKAGFVGLLTAVTGAAATAGATVMAFLARIPQLLAVILAVRVGTQVGEYAAKGLDWATGGRLSGRRALEQTAADSRARMDRSYDERVARLASRPSMPEPVRVGTAGTAQISAANVFSEYDFWGQSGSGAKDQVDVNFNVGGRHAGRLSGDRTAVDELTRALTDARAAGGLR